MAPGGRSIDMPCLGFSLDVEVGDREVDWCWRFLDLRNMTWSVRA